MDGMDKFNKANGGKKVSYKSRPGKEDYGGPVEVTDLVGWWLPAPSATASTPRIVVQHGFSSNSNKFRTMFLAYQLRSMGFSVLVNNFRDHCYSANSTSHTVEWGGAYPMDLLGAWDYAKNIAGGAGPTNASKVGILGISMGAFTTLNALGLEPEVPAVWVDAAPATPRDGFEVGFKKAISDNGIGFLAGMLADSAWKAITKYAASKGVNIHAHLPETVLPHGPDTKRPIFMVANVQDNTVPYASTQRLADFVKTLPTKYTLAELWINNDNCVGESHATDMMIHTEEYVMKMCKFWSGVFGLDAGAKCSKLPPVPAVDMAPTTPVPGQASPSFRLYEQDHVTFFNTLPSLHIAAIAASVMAAITGLALFARRTQPLRVWQQLDLAVEEPDLSDGQEEF